MALPDGGKDAKWPPADVKPYLDNAEKAAAWWTGDRAQLVATSGQAGDTQRRRFWQRRSAGNDATKATAQLHAPLAADIASTSASLLFGAPVTLTHPNEDVQTQINGLVKDLGLENQFVEGAETSAATGGVYLRPVWDTAFIDRPISRAHDQRHAIPDFRYGILQAVTLWEEIEGDTGAVVFRHLERHERGKILHGLYQGTRTELGGAISLDYLPATQGLEPEITLTGLLAGRLLVSYVPNQLPNRTGMKPIGRADWQGYDDFLDGVDEVWTSFMRDYRLGQARIIVPEQWLEKTGARPGQAKQLDMDTEAFVGLNIDDTRGDGSVSPTTYQPDIRTAAHLDGILGLVEATVGACGYSPQTFGLHIEGRADSGTALRLRQGKTSDTVGKKQRYWEPGLIEHTTNLLLIDGEIFGHPPNLGEERISVGWGEADPDPTEVATWITALRTARAMSIENAVAAAQPQLEGKDLDEEVARIKGENSIADPFPQG